MVEEEVVVLELEGMTGFPAIAVSKPLIVPKLFAKHTGGLRNIISTHSFVGECHLYSVPEKVQTSLQSSYPFLTGFFLNLFTSVYVRI